MDSSNPFDVLVIGGGPSGLAAASALARQLHTVQILDSHQYRNDGTSHMHTIPTWDSKSPTQVRADARQELLTHYKTVQYAEVEVKEVKEVKEEGIFQATSAEGKIWSGRKLVLATGSKDIYPDIEGYRDCWPECIFHCLLCQGYEERGCDSAGLLALDSLAAPPFTLMVSRQLLQLAKSGTIYTNGPNEDLVKAIEPTISTESRWTVDTRRIVRLQKVGKGAQVTLHFEDGTTNTEGFLAHHPNTHARGPFAQQLGLELVEEGDIKVFPPFNQTSRRGVFAGGDAGSSMKTLANALASGGFAGAGAMIQVQADKLEQQCFF